MLIVRFHGGECTKFTHLMYSCTNYKYKLKFQTNRIYIQYYIYFIKTRMLLLVIKKYKFSPPKNYLYLLTNNSPLYHPYYLKIY